MRPDSTQKTCVPEEQIAAKQARRIF